MSLSPLPTIPHLSHRVLLLLSLLLQVPQGPNRPSGHPLACSVPWTPAPTLPAAHPLPDLLTLLPHPHYGVGHPQDQLFHRITRPNTATQGSWSQARDQLEITVSLPSGTTVCSGEDSSCKGLGVGSGGSSLPSTSLPHPIQPDGAGGDSRQ